MQKQVSEAPESNAGDDFHVLWTIKKTFDLLNFKDNGLKAITIEGIDPKNSSKLDPLGNKLLGVDIVEYFGGENFDDSEKVIVSQLKYSTRRISENWTFSKLYSGKKSGSTDGSVFHRLSQIYKTFLEEYGRDLVLNKISLKLVSNRNINLKQKQIIVDVQHFLRKRRKSTYAKSVYNNFPEEEDVLRKIHTATKLNSTEFTDFLRLLDFEDCGTSSSYNQELEIIEALRNVGIQNLNQNDSLFRMVWRKMLPEAITLRKNKITEFDLLHCLQMSLERLFPVSEKFEKIKNIVARKQITIITNKIINNDTSKPMCLHGGAGIGKSVLIQLICRDFPAESEVILFDSYGAGSYLNPSDNRHLHKEALLQISNEMAKKLGSPFLLNSESEPYILIREFKSRVEDAVNILRKRDSNSILVLIVDAADNSVTAAQKNKTKSFIQDLVNEVYVEGFRLVVTSRSHRIKTLSLPEDSIIIPLEPFDLEETEKYLKFYLPKSTKKEIEDFHSLTNGIPRVQRYALELKQEGIEEVINYLKPNGKKVEDLIQEKIIESTKKLGSNGEYIINTFFIYLISLPRPVPLSYICEISGLNEGILHDLATDIWHGLVLNNSKFSFRDEDFENFIREKYRTKKEVYKKIADLFLHKADEDEYASINLGVALYEAEYNEKLKNIVLNEQYKTLPSDPIRKKEVYIERTKLAMKVSSDADDNLAFFKLAFIAADAAKTDIVLTNLIIQNADLVASFGESDSLQRLYFRSGEKSWSGSFHYQLAAIYSRDVRSSELARKHIKTADKWVDWLMQQKGTDEIRNYRITSEDIANGAEAYLRIYGSEAAIYWLNRWHPKENLFHATYYLIDNIFKYSSKDQIAKWLKPLNLSIYAKLIILEKVKFYEIYPFELDRIYNHILYILSKGVNFKIYILPFILSFCELYIKTDTTNKSKVLEILEYINIELPEHVPTLMDYSTRDDNEKLVVDAFLRKWSLKSALTGTPLTLEDIYPQKYKEIDKEENYETRNYKEDERKRFDRFYSHAISIYQLNADLLIKQDKEDLFSRFNILCKKIKDDWDFRYYDSHWVQYKLSFLALRIVDAIPYLNNGEVLIETVIQSFENKNQNRISLRVDIAKKVSGFKKQKQNTYKLLDEADSIIQESALTSSDMVNYYIQSAKIIRSIDKQVCKHYFEKAIEAVSEIDTEAQEQIRCIYKLSQTGIPQDNPRLAFEFARFVEFCESRLGGYDNFPLVEGIKGVSYLDSPTSFANICRWSHRYKAKITEQILPILEISLKKDFISPIIGSSLLPINIYYWKSYVEYIKLLLEKFDNSLDRNHKSNFIKNTLRDIQLDCNSSEKYETVKSIYSIIKNGRFIKDNVVQSFASYYQFITDLDNIKDNEQDYKRPNPSKHETKKGSRNNINFDEISFISTSSLNSILKKIKLDSNDYSSHAQASKFLSNIKNACPPENYVQHLDALIDVNPEFISLYTLESALKERLEDWSFNPLVKLWMKQNFGKALKIWFSNFNWNDQIYYDGIKKFADIFSIDDSALSTIIFEILPEKIDELSANALYQTIAFLRNHLDKEDNESLISWILPKWTSKIKSDFADGLWENKYLPSRNPDEVIAQTIRFVLGHPDKRIRWRGIHALRRIVNSGNSSILELLIVAQNNPNCLPFQHKDYTFFWISAKLYLWICIERLSKENPSIISQFKREIFNESQNKDLPHVLILYFVKHTCLNLIIYNKSLFTEDEIQLIKNLLVSKLNPVKEKILSRAQRNYNSNNGEWKFKFDSMDTLPYWYSNLGRCFNLSEYDVADLADKYISENWGYIGETRDDDHVQEDWQLTSNRHGSLPVVENTNRYYEYHGMYCAASELLEKEPLSENDQDWWGSWDQWIESKSLTWKEFWLSDLRDPIPLDRKFWVSEYNTFDKKWRDNIDDNYYDEVIGLKSDSELASIVVYNGYTRHFGENNETVSVRSAMVSSQTSESLLRALQTAKDHFDYRIPLENDNLQIDEGRFKLIGWLKEINSEHTELDKNDPFANGVGKSYILLGKEVEKTFHINYSEDFKQAFYKKEKIFEYQNWSDENERQNYNSFESSGVLALIDIKFLLNFLKKRELCLIIKCTISRHLKERDYSYKKSQRKNEAKIYLIKSNGEVKTIRGRSYKIG